MAYGTKFELFFQDIEQRRLKVEILQKNYSGSVKSLVGADNPVVIKWEGDDDIYSPIRGSRCILNLYDTDATDYDEFYNSDEREYKVKVLRYNSTGYFWESEESTWESYDAIWDASDLNDNFFLPIWEGFLVVDRFREQMISKPFPVVLEAIDGLGTLSGFDAPFDSSSNSTTSNLFFYLKEILLLTGHTHPIFISNDTRKTDGATNDSIFHDIVVDKYALFTKNLIFRNAKDVLEQILRVTNSRIFHSNARWYIVNNSSLIDTRIDQLALAPSGADISIEPAPPVPPTEEVVAPILTVLGNGTVTNTLQVYENTTNFFTVQNNGSPMNTFTWSYPLGTLNGTGNNPTLSFLVTSAHDGQTVTITGTNSEGSDTDSLTLDVLTSTPPDPPDPADQGGSIIINVSNLLPNTTVQPNRAVINFEPHQVGSTYTANFSIVPDSGYEITSEDSYTLSILGATATKTGISSGVATFTVSGQITSGGFTKTLSIVGNIPLEEFTTTINFTENVTNATLDSSSAYVATGVPDTAFSFTRTLTPDNDFYFNSTGRINALFTTGGIATRTLSLLTSDVSGKNPIRITISGIIGSSNHSDTLTLSGSPLSRIECHEITGGFVKVNWAFPQPVEGDEETRSVTVRFDNNVSTSPRYCHLRFLKFGTNTVLHQCSITQSAGGGFGN
jgi:hypothetical protein